MNPPDPGSEKPPSFPRGQREEVALLLELSRILAVQLELPQIYRQAVEAVARTFGYALVSLYTVEGAELVLQHQVGYSRFIERIALGEGTMSRAVSSGQTVFIPEAAREPDFLYALPGITSMVAVPIYARGQVRAVLCVESIGFSLCEGDCRLLEGVALQVGGAVERGLLAAALLEGERLYRALVETMPAALVLFDEKRFVYANPRALELLGVCSLEGLQQRSLADFSHPEAPLSLERYLRVLQGEAIERAEDRLNNLRGEVIDFEVSAYPVELDGRVLGLAMGQDITQRKRAEAALRRSENLLRTLMQHSREVVQILDPQGNLLYTSTNAAVLGFGTSQSLLSWVVPEHRDKAGHLFAEALGRTEGVGPAILPLQNPSSPEEWAWFEVSWENRLADPDIGGIVLRARDVSEQRAYQATIQHLAYHDELTGLPNRRSFHEQAAAILRRAASEGSGCALLYLDLDQFKGINDSLGHAAGDKLLLQVARRLERCVREGDLLARLGGDEMAIMAKGVGEAGAQALAGRVRSAFAEPFSLSGLQVVVTVSIGIALFPQHGADLDGLMRAADLAMYASKEGRDRWTVYQPRFYRASRRQLELLQDLRKALREDALKLVYQPILPLRQELAPKAEALLRWVHPARGLIPPTEFIPLAEVHGLASALDTWVLRQALREGPSKSFQIGVNLSAITLLNPRLVRWLNRALRSAKLDPSSLYLEVTETSLLRDFASARANLEAVRQLEVQVALDDFGVGHTTLAYLSRLPVDLVKVDRSFTAGIGNPSGEALLAGILSLAKGLGMSTVVEGVETPPQLDWLRANGCDYVQGYFIAKPGGREELA
ncbi:MULTISPECIES: EAL domain-containing protein [unclassified Meiothermus]|uniref:EAL domain-containing protein n=1 Tax=unclassified Meiothermus TaxID=370471 RepID=UPI000D7C9CFA|nr:MULTISPECIES: EAL domain-containing protein [unclassified Meiothermus]PZA08345.1 hypothetical protein DNA98_04210 [Meiothermus sp. Pnk-1]RYM36550.1 EAL domain-containing protein [Meiothermus sp. PNK-Is4]